MLWNCVARTIPQSPDGAPDRSAKGPPFGKRRSTREALLSFPRRTRLPTTKSISSEPLYHHLSSTVPIYLRSPPSQPQVGLHLPGTSTSSTACQFFRKPIAEPIPRSPSSIIHARLRSKLYPRRLVRVTGCRRLGSPTLSCESRCTLQAQSTNQSPTAAIIACLLGHPCFFLRQSALEVLSSFDTSARQPV